MKNELAKLSIETEIGDDYIETSFIIVFIGIYFDFHRFCTGDHTGGPRGKAGGIADQSDFAALLKSSF